MPLDARMLILSWPGDPNLAKKSLVTKVCDAYDASFVPSSFYTSGYSCFSTKLLFSAIKSSTSL